MANKRSAGKRSSGSGSRSRSTSSSKGREKKKNTTVKEYENRQKPSKGLYDEIVAIIMLVTGIFIAVSMHTELSGAVGDLTSDFLKGMFGLVAFVLPYFMILYSISVFAKVNRPFKGRTILWLAIIFLMITFINSGRFLEDFSFADSEIGSIYNDGIRLENGGVAGMYLGKLVETAIGPVGLYLFSFTVIVIFCILTFNTPISDILKRSAEKREQKRAISAEISEKIQEDSSDDYIDFSSNSEASARMKQKINDNRKKKNILSILKNDDVYGLKNVEKNRDNEIQEEMNLDKDNSINEKKPDSMREKSFMEKSEKMYVSDAIKMNETAGKKKIDNELQKTEPVEKQSFESNTHNDTHRELTESVDMFRKESSYVLPGLDLLNIPTKNRDDRSSEDNLVESAELLENTLKSFNVEAKVINVTKGSSVTRYEIQPAIGTKVASIVRLADNIALNLRARSIRMEAPIPGKAAVGIEVENEKREMVSIREMVGSEEFMKNSSKLAFAVGKDIGGKPVIADLAKMPHMLIAGATGSGKSVCVNSIIASILYKAAPDEVKLLLIDPKMVELGNYNGIPHLLIPVVTDPSKAAAALNWAVAEMTARYKKFASSGVRDLKGYNSLMKEQGDEVLPQIVIIIDELADLMMVASSQVEEAICRLAQLARAAGMHLIVATQRPSVDVVTGLIKANIPSRIAFMVSSQIDSRTIIDMPGAEKLVGNGDMLFKPQDLDKPIRIQGPFISDEEVRNLIEFVSGQIENVDYDNEMIEHIDRKDHEKSDGEEDVLMEDAVETVVRAGQASVSMLQRRFRIGYNRAARIIDDMERKGIVGPQDGSRPRSVLMTVDELEGKTNSSEKKEEKYEIPGDQIVIDVDTEDISKPE